MSKTRVLVVEDEALIGMTLTDILESLGLQTIGPVAQLESAIAAAKSESFDLARPCSGNSPHCMSFDIFKLA